MIGLLVLALLPLMGQVDTGAGVASQSPHKFAFTAQSSEAEGPLDRAQMGTGADGATSAPIYRLSGEKSLRPVRIGDDGTHMYLEWSEEQALPAVFALNALGEEEMVDGYMRQGIFTIDRVHRSLVFIIGKKRARAVRVNK